MRNVGRYIGHLSQVQVGTNVPIERFWAAEFHHRTGRSPSPLPREGSICLKKTPEGAHYVSTRRRSSEEEREKLREAAREARWGQGVEPWAEVVEVVALEAEHKLLHLAAGRGLRE